MTPTTPPPEADDQEVMRALRELIVGPEKEKIEDIEHKITEIAHPVATVEDVAQALPEAIRLRISRDESLQHALQPLTEQAIRQSVLQNPEPLSEALFPIMGPAIRRSIHNTINGMLQSMNQALEHSLSLRGIRWRIQAWRTGKSFAEIVLLNTLVYRVEQILVIHRESGLLIAHIARDAQTRNDADLVSSMLTAVRDFVRDSFAPDANADIESLRMGDLQLLIGQGPHVTLALVCRGEVPQDLYTLMDEHLEALQREYGRAFARFDGDTSLFVGIEQALQPLMRADYQNSETRQHRPIRAMLFLAALLIPLLGWIGYDIYLDRLWLNYVERLRTAPGIAVLHAETRHGRYTLHGLLDPEAGDPRRWLPEHLPTDKVDMHWRPYHSLEESIVLRRAKSLLQPPPSVSLRFHDGVLQARGAASAHWIERIQRQATWIPGVLKADIQLRNLDLEPLPEKVRRLLAPPPSVRLQLEEKRLQVSGEATQAWQRRARDIVAKRIPEIEAYDDSRLIVVDAPEYLLRIAQARLKPPSSVRLHVDGKRRLHIRGQARKAWLEQAREEAAGIPYLAALETRDLQIVDSPEYLLRLAQKRLRPPAETRLSVSRDLVLHARGEAPTTWILRAREKAKHIPYLQGYDDSGLVDPYDRARVLRAAKRILRPPSGVLLDYRNGRLYAGGQADGAWIEQARKLASGIRGVDIYDDRQLFDPEQLWQEMRQRIRKVHIAFVAGTSTWKGRTEADKLKDVAESFHRANKAFPDSVLEISGSSSLYGERAEEIAAARARLVGAALQDIGVPSERQYQRVRIVRDRQWGVSFDLLRPKLPTEE